MIFILRTTVGRENSVVNSMSRRVKNFQIPIQSIFRPSELRGYIFIEGEMEEINRATSGVPHVRGLIKKECDIASIERFLEEKKIEIKVNMGDIVEVTGGPFKNERGKVRRVDEAKEEITIELVESPIPIPITISVDSVRMIESAEKREEQNA